MISRLLQSKHTAYIALVIGILCIGFSAIFVKLANVSGEVSAFYRVLFAGIAILPIWVYQGMRLPPRDTLWLIVGGGVFFAVDLYLWNTSILLTNAATATLLANNAPVWVGLISFICFKEHLSYRFWVGLLVAILGMNILVGFDAWQNLSLNRGDLLAILASLFYAFYLISTLFARKKVDTITFMTTSVCTSIIVLFF